MTNRLEPPVLGREWEDTDTYEAMFVWDVIGQLQFVEGDHFLHPLLSGAWRIWVDIHPLWHFRVCFTGDHPTGIVELVSAVVHGHGIHKQNVFCTFVQTRNAYFEWREHSSAKEKKQASLLNKCFIVFAAVVKETMIMRSSAQLTRCTFFFVLR